MDLPAIHLLQAAITLAEVRNYSRAARKLGIQQPTLTKWILELEHTIGLQLFNRTTQFVEPTDACRKFVEEAKQSIFHAERAVHVARIAEQEAETVLHIGKSQYTDPYLITMLSSVSLPLFPKLEVALSSMLSADLESEVILGRLDLALATGEFESPKLTQLELMRTPFYIALREQTPLARHRELKLSQLHHLTWLLFERRVHPNLYDSVLQASKAEGIQPRSIHHVATAEEAAQELYSASADIAFLTRAGAWRIGRQGITMRPLSHPDLFISVKLIARANESSRLVSEFVRTLKRKIDAPRRVQLALSLNHSKSQG